MPLGLSNMFAPLLLTPCAVLLVTVYSILRAKELHRPLCRKFRAWGLGFSFSGLGVFGFRVQARGRCVGHGAQAASPPLKY